MLLQIFPTSEENVVPIFKSSKSQNSILSFDFNIMTCKNVRLFT